MGEDKATLKQTLASVGIFLKPSVFDWNVKPLLREALYQFFGDMSGFADMCISNLPSPIENASSKVETTYNGDSTSKYVQSMNSCDPNGPLMIQIVKMFNVDDVTKFDVFGRIMSGTIKIGQKVKVLGEGYSPDDEEDMSIQEVTGLAIFESRYAFKLNSLN